MTIDTFDVYLSRTSNRTGWNIYAKVYNVGLYTDNPAANGLLGTSDAVLVDNVPVHGSPDWVTFTFSTPITITDGGFYGVLISTDTISSYQTAGVYWYNADTGVGVDDWYDATSGEPYTGKERGWYQIAGGSWVAGGTRAYKLNCTGISGNKADTPLATYTTLISSLSSGTGTRSYLPIPPPTEPTNPTPENNDTETDFSGLQLSWDDGGGADTYNVYIGKTGDLDPVSTAQAGTTYTTTLAELETIFGADPIAQKIYWRVDATNGGGTTTGYEWNFDARPGKVATVVPADEAAGITLDATTTSWSAPSANADSYNIYYGFLSGFLSLVGNTADLELALRSTNFPSYGDIIYWRADSVNDFGTTTGDETYFTTLIFRPPTPSGVTWTDPGNDATAGYTGTPTGVNNMLTVKRLVVAANNAIWVESA